MSQDIGGYDGFVWIAKPCTLTGLLVEQKRMFVENAEEN